MNSNKKSFIPNYKLSIKDNLIAISIILISLFFLKFETFLKINTHFIGGYERDSGLYIWLSNFNINYLFDKEWFSTNFFYPYSFSLAWSDNFILPGIFTHFLKLIFNSKALIWNLLILTSIFLNAYCTFFLLIKLSNKFIASLISSIAVISLSFFTYQLGHPQLQFFFFIPIGIYLIFEFIDKQNFRYSFLLGLNLTLCFLTTAYYAIFLAIVYIFLFAIIFIQKSNQTTLKTFACSIYSFLGLLPLIPFLLPYFNVKETFGERRLYEPMAFSADIYSYFSSSIFNTIYGMTSKYSHSEGHIFSGIIIYLILILAFIRLTSSKKLRVLALLSVFIFSLASFLSLQIFTLKFHYEAISILLYLLIISAVLLLNKLGKLESKRKYSFFTNRNIIGSFLFLALIFFIISWGPQVGLYSLKQGYESYTFSFYVLLYKFFPGFDSIRACSRAGIFVIYFIILTIPFVIPPLIKEIKYKKIAYMLIIFLILLENYTPNYPLEKEIKKPDILIASKNCDPNSSAIILPFSGEIKSGKVKSWSTFSKLNVNYMNWLADSSLSFVNGYSGLRTNIIKNYPRKLSNFPDQRSINSLSLISNLDYVFFLSSQIEDFNENIFEANLNTYKEYFSIINKNSNGDYLLKFSPSTKIDNDFYLSFPSTKGKLLLKIISDKDTKIDLLIDNKFFKNIKINKEQKNYKINFDKNLSRTKPRILNFSNIQSELFLKDRRFINE